MKQWVIRIALLALLACLAFILWGILFPNPERQIRKRLAEIAQAASFPAKESPAAQAMNANHLTTFCTEDVEVVVELPGRSRHTATGRDELFQGAMAARNFAPGLQVEFLDVNITMAPDKQSAVADLTAKGKVPGEKDILVQELKIKLRKIGRGWYLQRVETVKSLSHRNFKPQTSTFRETANFKIQNRLASGSLSGMSAALKFYFWKFPEAWNLQFEDLHS